MSSAYLWVYPWLKAFHVIGVVCWFAGLFYLPRLFVYHCATDDAPGRARFEVMEAKLFRIIMRPSLAVTLVFGIAMIVVQPALLEDLWLWLKLAGVLALLGYHHYCGRLIQAFAEDRNPHSEKFYRAFNEAPALLLIAIVILVVVKPF